MPFVIPALALAVGWRGALVVGGIGGFVSLAAWMWLARGLSQLREADAEPEGVALIEDSDSYSNILTNRQTWGIVIAKALSDMTWWFINFWLADYYRKEFGLSTLELAIPLAIAFAGSGLGAFFAGWLSTRLLELGWSVQPGPQRRDAYLGSGGRATAAGDGARFILAGRCDDGVCDGRASRLFAFDLCHNHGRGAQCQGGPGYRVRSVHGQYGRSRDQPDCGTGA